MDTESLGPATANVRRDASHVHGLLALGAIKLASLA